MGVAVGVLFAPKAGTETRGFIRDKAEEGVDYVKRRGEDLRDTAAETIDRGKETLRRQKENLARRWTPANKPIATRRSNPPYGVRARTERTLASWINKTCKSC